jgi:hypothetical protein
MLCLTLLDLSGLICAMGRRAALTAVLSTLITLLVASSASAVWTHKGKGELKENASVTLKGTLTLSSSAGNVACATEIGTTLTASSSSGHVNSFTVAKPSECDLTGSLAAICGTNGLTKVEKTGSWALTADETDVTLSSIDVHYAMAGCLIPSFELKGSATLSLDKATAFSTAAFSGTQTLYNALGEESGTGELKGTLSATPAGTYGVKTAASVETRWTDANAPLGSDGKLTLSGSFSFEGSGGSISCPATVKLLLESSTVEEEEAEGEIESFTVSKAAECDLGGNYKTTCGTNAVAKVQQTGTATLNATSEDITVNGLVLDYELEKCAITELKVEGSPTISVTSPEAISSATFSAGSLEVFNSKGETLNTATAGGSASASPAGTFQLVDNTHAEETAAHAATTHAHETAATEHEATTIEGPVWTTTDGTISGKEEALAVETEGEITSSFGGLNTTVPIRFEGEVWNGVAHGEGSINAEAGAGFVPGIPTSICTVEVTLVGGPWSIALTMDTEIGAETDDATVDMSEVGFINHYSHGCFTASGGAIPTKGAATGTVTATAETNGDHVDLTLAATQDLYLTNAETWKHITTAEHVALYSNPSPLVLQTVDPEGSIGVEQH